MQEHEVRWHPPFAGVLWEQRSLFEVIATHAVDFVGRPRDNVHKVLRASIEDSGVTLRVPLEDHPRLVTLAPGPPMTVLADPAHSVRQQWYLE
jgi:hypothetical protein